MVTHSLKQVVVYRAIFEICQDSSKWHRDCSYLSQERSWEFDHRPWRLARCPCSRIEWEVACGDACRFARGPLRRLFLHDHGCCANRSASFLFCEIDLCAG